MLIRVVRKIKAGLSDYLQLIPGRYFRRRVCGESKEDNSDNEISSDNINLAFGDGDVLFFKRGITRIEYDYVVINHTLPGNENFVRLQEAK